MMDLNSNMPVPGVSAVVCRKLDIDCAGPVVTGLVSDASGKISVQVPAGFDGYVKLTPPSAIPGSYFFSPPLTSDRIVPFVPIVGASYLGALQNQAHVTVMPDRGLIFLGVYNCLGQPGAGVHLSSANEDDKSQPFYLIAGLPNIAYSTTDSAGYGGILNIPAGTVALTGTLSTTGQTVGTVSVLTRPGEITYAALVPSPQ